MFFKLPFVGLLLLSSILFAQNNPKIYATLGDKLFDAVAKFALVQYTTPTLEKIISYRDHAKKIYEKGMKLQSKGNLSSKEKKAYLSLLRKLNTEYENIIYLLRKDLLESIEQENYKLFVQISTIELEDLLAPKSIQTKAIAYYKKNKTKKTIAPLEKIIIYNKIQIQTSDTVITQKKNKTTINTTKIVLDQENTPVGGRGGLEITKKQSVAQSFRVGQLGKLSSIDIVDLQQHRCKPTKSLYISLISMEKGNLGVHSLYTREIHPDELSPTIKLHFGRSAVKVKPGEEYAIFLQSDAKPGGCTYSWGGAIKSYKNGKAFINTHANIRDMKFRTYVTTTH